MGVAFSMTTETDDKLRHKEVSKWYEEIFRPVL
jgi:hypothetical protein